MDFFQKNIQALRRQAPVTAAWVSNARPDSDLELWPRPGGRPDLRINQGTAQSFLLYGAQDPVALETEQARRLAENAPQLTVLFGLGPGYLVEALCGRLEKGHSVFVIEENPALVKLAFTASDLAASLESGQLTIIPFDLKSLEKLASDLSRFFRQGRAGLVVNEKAHCLFSEKFKTALDGFRRKVMGRVRLENALIENAQAVTENEIINLPLTVTSPDVSRLQGLMTGIPAVVVSAGPSLTSALPFLAAAAGRAVIVATAPVLRVLLAHDLRPDLVGILDFTPSNYDVLRDAYQTEDVPLVFLEATYPRVVREYQGPLISALHTKSPLRRWLGPQLGLRGHLDTGRNVGSFCLDLAVFMGADPIILVGQDLSFPERQSHSQGVVGRRELKASPNDEVWLESVSGGRVMSNPTFASYRDEFERAVARSGGTFINISPGGARIKGTVEASPSEVLATWLTEERNIAYRIGRALADPPESAPEVRSELGRLIEELKLVGQVASQALGLNLALREQLTGQGIPDDPEIVRLINSHVQFTTRVENYWRVFEPLQQCLTSSLAGLVEKPDSRDDWRGRAFQALEANQVLMEKARASVRGLIPLMRRAQKELEAFETGTGLEAVRIRSGLGRLDQAWETCRSELAQSGNDPLLLLEGIRILLKRERLDAAASLGRSLAQLEPDRPETAALMDEAESIPAQWIERAEEALGQGDWVTAQLMSRKVMAHRPENEAAHRIEQECRVLRREGLAEAEAKAALLFERRRLNQLTLAAEKAFHAGRTREVIDLLAAENLKPDNADHHQALTLKAAALADQGHKDKGLSLMRDMIGRRPEWAYIPAVFGPVLLKNGLIGPGTAMLEKAGVLDHRYGEMLFQAGCLRLKAGEFREALADFEIHLKAFPASYETMNKLAVCHLAGGSPGRAVEYFKKVLSIRPDNQTALVGLRQLSKAAADHRERAAG